MLRHAVAALVLIVGFGCGNTQVVHEPQPQAKCTKPMQLNAVGDCVACVDNADCLVTQTCNLLTGTCETTPVIPDAGPVEPTCSLGAVRCAPDGHAVQVCVAEDGGTGWADQTECTGGEICNPMTLTCAICQPGETVCAPDAGPAAFLSCKVDGTGYTLESCDSADAGTTGYTCDQIVPPRPSTDGGPPQAGLTACQLCPPSSRTCAAATDGGVGLIICDSTGATLEYAPCYPTNECIADGGVQPYCEPYVCFPGQDNCVEPDGGTPPPDTSPARQSCNSNGTGWVQNDCTGSLLCGPQGNDQGACLTACQVVEGSSSYFGCDYWGSLLSNSALAQDYLGNSTNGAPGTTPSDFAFVVSNTNPNITVNATVTMNDLPNITATIGPNSVVPIYLPWQSICGSGVASFGYHLTTDNPVTVYQFNPLHSFVTADGPNGSSCNQDADCQASCCPFCDDPTCLYGCLNNGCVSYAYTNDASLLLPTHLLGTSYVVASWPEITEGSNGNATDPPLAGSFDVVATENNTFITIQFAGNAASTSTYGQGGGAGEPAVCETTQGNIPAQSAGTSQPISFSLSAGQVLQFWADPSGTPNCAGSKNGDTVCQYPNDFTGTVITSVPGTGTTADGGSLPAQPIAVFGGADCTYVPFNQVACDHIEEEMFPFNTWGKEYVGVKTADYSGATSAYPDYFRLISACGPTSCPNGATVTFTPPLSATGLEGGNLCQTSGSTTVCTLPPLAAHQTAPWIGFQSATSFHVISDQPVALAQYLVSQSEAGYSNGASTATEGDPDLLLAPPVEQWRTTYTVLAPNTFLDNYIDMAVEQDTSNPNATENVLVDGAPIPASEWNQIPGTDFYAANHHVCGRTNSGCSGSHTISSAQPVGVQISGYDSYVSYSYTGGLDLQTITAIKPGG